MTGWIEGKDEILKFCYRYLGFYSWRSLRRWKKKHSFPIHYLPNGKPYIIEREMEIYLLKYEEIKNAVNM